MGRCRRPRPVYRWCWPGAVALPLALLTTSAAAEAPVEHAVLMVGETVPDRSRFVGVSADETRTPIPATDIRVYRDQDGLLYLFDLDRPLDRVCIARTCGVFTPVPERNGRFALFPAHYQRSEDGRNQPAPRASSPIAP